MLPSCRSPRHPRGRTEAGNAETNGGFSDLEIRTRSEHSLGCCLQREMASDRKGSLLLPQRFFSRPDGPPGCLVTHRACHCLLLPPTLVSVKLPCPNHPAGTRHRQANARFPQGTAGVAGRRFSGSGLAGIRAGTSCHPLLRTRRELERSGHDPSGRKFTIQRMGCPGLELPRVQRRTQSAPALVPQRSD